MKSKHIRILALAALALPLPGQRSDRPVTTVADIEHRLSFDTQTAVAIPASTWEGTLTQASPWQLALMASRCARTGRLDAQRTFLVALQARPQPYRDWATQQLAKLQAPAAQGGKRKPRAAMSDYLERTVRMLDGMPNERKQARAELHSLGALALPTILKHLPKFGPIGMKEALELALPHLDARVVGTLRTMLKYEDPIVQTIAASAVPRLRGDHRIELGRIAMTSDSEEARLHGVQALLAAGVEYERCKEVLDTLRNSSSSSVRGNAHDAMGHARFHDDSQIDTWLEAGIASDPMTGRSALDVWMRRRGSKESGRLLRMFKKVTPSLQERMISAELDKPVAARNHELLLEGIAIKGVALKAIDAVPPKVVTSDLPRLRRLLREAPQVRSRYNNNTSAMEVLLDVLANRPTKGVEAELRALIQGSPMAAVRHQAFQVLAKTDPDWLLDNHTRFLNADMIKSFVNIIRMHARPEDLPWILRASQDPTTGGWMGSAANAAFSKRTDASCLETCLDALQTQGSTHPLDSAAMNAIYRWFEPSHVTPTLRRLDEVGSHARTLVALIVKHAQPDDAPALVSAIRTLVRRGIPAPAPRRGRSQPPRHIVFDLLETLGPFGGEGTRYLLTLLSHERVGPAALRAAVAAPGADRAAIYGRILDIPEPVTAAWVKVVTVALEDPWLASNPQLRKKALQTLQDFPQDHFTSVAILYASPKDEARSTAIAMLRRIGTGQQRLIRDVLNFLGDFRDPELIPELAIALESRDAYIRRTAVEQIGRTLSRLAAPHLIEALGDDDANTRKTAEEHLDTISTILQKKRKYLEEFRKLGSDK